MKTIMSSYLHVRGFKGFKFLSTIRENSYRVTDTRKPKGTRIGSPLCASEKYNNKTHSVGY